jgi:hypothetical protein
MSARGGNKLFAAGPPLQAKERRHRIIGAEIISMFEWLAMDFT